MEVVNGYMKPFNDGLYAAIEMAAQRGVSGELASKQEFLALLYTRLMESLALATPAQQESIEQALIFVAAGLMVGNANAVGLPADLLTQAEKEVDTFNSDAWSSRPIGFYTWNEILQEVFRQDRYLQNRGERTFLSQGDSGFGLFSAIAVELEQDAQLLEQYQQLLAIYPGLTNPYVAYTPLDLLGYVDGLASLDDVANLKTKFDADHQAQSNCEKGFALIPASGSKETDFFKAEQCEQGTQRTDFMDRLIGAIRNGELDLKPDSSSGWYDYQVYALETMLLPERGMENDHLLLTAAYKQKLIESFKSIITQTRETHVKQLDTGERKSGAVKEIDIYPKFPVEPFPTFYLRTARAYRFLGTFLQGVLGSGIMGSLQRLKEDGTQSTMQLDQELRQMTELLYGLYILTARSVGLDPEQGLLTDETAEFEIDACVQRAQDWIANWRTHPDIMSDPRVIVPFWKDELRATNIYWAVLGVKVIKISAECVEGYEPEVLESPGCQVKEMVGHTYYLLMEQMVQVEIPISVPPPTRDEFRSVCDKHDTTEDIVTALSNLGT
jgi:hypothetical protein